MRRTDYPDGPSWAEGAARAIAADMADAPPGAGLALAGGTTPAPVYARLGPLIAARRDVVVFPGDERAVGRDNPRNNAAMISRSIGENISIQDVYDPKFRHDLNSAASAGAQALGPALPPHVAVLGMGGDMHTASLFPGDPDLDAALADDAPPIVATRTTTEEPRLSLSAPMLRRAAHVHLLIRGPAKAAALARAVELGDPRLAPVCLVLDRAHVHYTEAEDD